MPEQYTQRALCCFFTLFTSTSSSMERTPTAPPVKEATMGSTSPSWLGMPRPEIHSA